MFGFSLQLVSEIFLTLRRNERDMIKNVYWSSCKVSVILVRFSRNLVSLNRFKKNDTNIKFHENPSIGSRSVPCGRTDGQTDRRVDRRTDVTKLIVAFRNLATVPKKGIKQLKDDKIHQILCSLFRDFRNRWKKVMEKVTPEPFWSLMFF